MARKRTVVRVGAVADEFAGVQLGDSRLDRRVPTIVQRLAKEPSASFPSLMVTQKEQEAFYRFLRNEKVTLEGLLKPHAAATVQRAAQYPIVIVAHDTTEVSFKGEGRSELYELRPGTYGFGIHLSLAIAFGEVPCPLGVLEASFHSDPKGNRDRWAEQALAADAKLEKHPAPIHVGDREADVYAFFAELIQEGARFVVRARHDRLLDPDGSQERTLMMQLESQAKVLATRTIVISERRATAKGAMPDERKARPPRKSRRAKLVIRACRVTLPRPQRQAKDLPQTIQVNVVEVREPNPPRGTEPVHWLLVTTEPIETREEVLLVVDMYRARWLIEEYFKALKTGCAYEARQLEQLETFQVALGLLIPIAWQLLLIRACSRIPDFPARSVVSATQLEVLRILCTENDHDLPSKPTAHDIMMGVARLGGHIRQNGEPGWLVLWRGYKKVLEAESFLEVAKKVLKTKINA